MTVRDKWLGRSLIKLDTDAIEKIIVNLAKKDSRICVVYMFGSRVDGSVGLESDVDIGIYTDANFTWDDTFHLYGQISLELKSDRLDLVWLNKADPFFRFYVVCEGRALYSRDELILNELELLVRKMYRDAQLFFNRIEVEE